MTFDQIKEEDPQP